MVERTEVMVEKLGATMKHLKLALLLVPLFAWTCENSPVDGNRAPDNYIPMSVGDTRQIVFLQDSSTILRQVVGETYRKDGTKVFVVVSKEGTGEQLDTSYHFFRDGYYIWTKLDTTSNPEIKMVNPFYEQVLGKRSPTEGDTIMMLRGDSAYWLAAFADERQELGGDFKKIVSFTKYFEGMSVMTTFYAQDVGYIGTTLQAFDMMPFSCSYIKVNNVEYGGLWPEKDSHSAPELARTSNVF